MQKDINDKLHVEVDGPIVIITRKDMLDDKQELVISIENLHKVMDFVNGGTK